MGPQGESTRRMDDLSINLPSMRNTKPTLPTSFEVNTSALGRTFPEWSRWNHQTDVWEDSIDNTPNPRGKENVTPRGSPNSSIVATPRADDSDRDKIENAKPTNEPTARNAGTLRSALRSRAQMQPRVQTESECSLDLSEPLIQPLQDLEEQGSRRRASTPSGAKGPKSRRGNVTALLETLKTAQSKQAESSEQSAKEASPKSSPSVQPQNAAKLLMERQSGMHNVATPATPNQTARSFFLPNLSHMNDFISGALRLSSMRNGMPIFVKHGKVHDRESTTTPSHHADVEAVAIPEDEEKIFVSLDKIKDEVHALKEHDDLVSKQAEQLQEEVEELHIQVAKYKSRKDSAMGSDSESSVIDHLHSQKTQLEEQVNSLQARLDKANRKISINEIHTESYIAERDEALKSATEHLNRIQHLQSELNAARQNVGSLYNDTTQDANALELENKSLRKDNNTIRQQWKSLLEENQSLRAHNSNMSEKNADLEQDLQYANAQIESTKGELEAVQKEYEMISEEKAILKQDNLSLERHNDKFFNDNKVLKQQNSLLNRRTHDLQDDVARLQKLLDAAEDNAGPMSADFKDIKYRLQVQNRELAKENAELQQQVIDIQADFSTKRMVLEKEKRRLAAVNERLKEQIDRISDQFEAIVKQSKEEAAKYEEQQTALTQQLELITDKESALAHKLKRSADHSAKLQSELDRKMNAVNEARQMTREIKEFMNATNSQKDTRLTRIVDPKGKSVASENTARSTTQTDMPMQDDYTQQIDLTQGSDFASIYTQGEMHKLRDALRQVRNQPQRNDFIQESSAFEDDDMSDQASQSLPPLIMPLGQSRSATSQRTVSAATSKERTGSTKPQPVGILKDTLPSRLNSRKQKTTQTMNDTDFEEYRERETATNTATGGRKSKTNDTSPRKVSFGRSNVRNTELNQPSSEPDLTGRFSVKSGGSGMSITSEASDADRFHRRNSDSARFDIEMDHEDNMTSALFMDDITLEQQKIMEKQNAKKSSKTELSNDAKRVLDGLCHDHDCRNCIVCSRINSQGRGDQAANKKAVRVDKPIPVTNRVPKRGSKQVEYEDQSTLRPSQDPAVALAKVIKALEDEERHLLRALQKKDAAYNEFDPSVQRRVWKKLGAEIDKLRRARDLKRDQIYYLYDALEGQKRTGQEMTAEFAEYTIMSAMSKDQTWNGIMDF